MTFLYPGESGELEPIQFNEACAKGAGEFCIRALICPTSHTGGNIWIAAHPSTKAEMKARMGDLYNTHATPHITIKVLMTFHKLASDVHMIDWKDPLDIYTT